MHDIVQLDIAVGPRQEAEGTTLYHRSHQVGSENLKALPHSFEYDEITVGADRAEPRRDLVDAPAPLFVWLQIRDLYQFHVEARVCHPRAIGCQQFWTARIEHQNVAIGSLCLEIVQKRREQLRAVAR
jgi:hypothetical protein